MPEQRRPLDKRRVRPARGCPGPVLPVPPQPLTRPLRRHGRAPAGRCWRCALPAWSSSRCWTCASWTSASPASGSASRWARSVSSARIKPVALPARHPGLQWGKPGLHASPPHTLPASGEAAGPTSPSHHRHLPAAARSRGANPARTRRDPHATAAATAAAAAPTGARVWRDAKETLTLRINLYFNM